MRSLSCRFAGGHAVLSRRIYASATSCGKACKMATTSQGSTLAKNATRKSTFWTRIEGNFIPPKVFPWYQDPTFSKSLLFISRLLNYFQTLGWDRLDSSWGTVAYYAMLELPLQFILYRKYLGRKNTPVGNFEVTLVQPPGTCSPHHHSNGKELNLAQSGQYGPRNLRTTHRVIVRTAYLAQFGTHAGRHMGTPGEFSCE